MANNREKVEDIFSDASSENKPSPQVQKPSPVPQRRAVKSAMPLAPEGRTTFPLRTVVTILIVLIVLGAAAFAVVNFFNKRSTPSSTNTVANIAAENTNVMVPSASSKGDDADGDGLTDEEEASLGTNPNLPDSDSDGLFDRDEVRVYNTNPLVSDTDGDGVKDGSEVQAGTNPAGPGLLLDLNREKEKL